MTTTAGQRPANLEALTPAVNPEGDQPQSQTRIPRKWRDDAIRVLHGNGYAVSGAQAWRLIKEWRDWRAEDAREFIASEFLAYAKRRGDLIQPRGKRNYRLGETGWHTVGGGRNG